MNGAVSAFQASQSNSASDAVSASQSNSTSDAVSASQSQSHTTSRVASRVILGIDPGLAHTGWGVVKQSGSKLACLAYGCIETTNAFELPFRLQKIYQQMVAVVTKYKPSAVGVETVWFGQNAPSAFATGQARGAALAACATSHMHYAEYSPRQIKLAVVGTGSADKAQVQYMVQHLLALKQPPSPDHAADALAAAICLSTHRFEDAFGKGGSSQLSSAAQRRADVVSNGNGISASPDKWSSADRCPKNRADCSGISASSDKWSSTAQRDTDTVSGATIRQRSRKERS